MTTIYLIRHAEAEGNLYRFVQGHYNSEVTGKGLRQIHALSKRFEDIHVDALYSSDLKRTLLTSTAITVNHGLEPIIDPQLREIYMGVCEGISFGDMTYMDPQQMYYFNNDPDSWRAEDAETFGECTERIYNAISKIAAKHDGETVAIVSHGMAIRSFLAKVAGISSTDIRSMPHGDNTAVSLLHYDNGKFDIEYYNDNSHLPEDMSTFAKQTWWRKDYDGKDDANLRYEVLDPYEDYELYSACYADAWRAAHGSTLGFSPEPYVLTAMNHHDLDEKSIMAVIRGEDEFVGLVELDPEKGKGAGYGWISLLYLRPDCRGMGLGIQPLGYAIIYYQMQGRRAVRLNVSSENTHAVGFYEHYGFEIIGKEPGSGAPLYLMEKKIR